MVEIYQPCYDGRLPVLADYQRLERCCKESLPFVDDLQARLADVLANIADTPISRLEKLLPRD
ncbi:hypothetical protein C3731_09675 [Brucella oryzae]|uniref:Uncharacterized protein n=1 Tax=Brucella oryzae TaxID=335286 RepID=A0A2S7IZV0_9HYPH|nr:hypothetical protein C3731_09675 [Brucella oryzae]